MMDRNLLNEAQWQAVEYIDGPELVIAGAGSGKTRVLTYKIAYLLEHGLMSWEILALTFTNKAAREMKGRIAAIVGQTEARGLWMGTFHSVFSRIIRMEAEAMGYDKNFTIYDADDSQRLIKSIVKGMNLDDKVYSPKMLAERISKAKERLLTPNVLRNNVDEIEFSHRKRVPELFTIYERYQQRLRQSNAMDFDDLLLNTYLLFRDNEDIRLRYAKRFKYILVDEYQDTNYAQHVIIQQLASEHGRVCVVGDDAQSIYSFRGANIDNILNLDRSFPTLRMFKLEQNYRSTQTIVQAANSVINKNRNQFKKDVYSEKEVGEPLRILTTYSDIEEADVVARRIAALTATKYAPHDIAVLYRQNFQSRTFEDALRKMRVSYRIYGGMSFYQRKEVKDVIAYCRLAVNPNDEEALRRVINYPTRGIGETTVVKVAAEALTSETSMWDVMQQNTLDVNAGTRRKLQAFVELIQSFVEGARTMNAAELVFDIVKRSGINDELRTGQDTESVMRRQNVEELVNACSSFVEGRKELGEEAMMSDYLQEVSLISTLDENDDDDDRVTLMTIHASKGLEFPVVFVVGMEEELFPGEQVWDIPRAIEEERRLFYVAITRAGELCYLSYAKTRYRFGRTNYESPSRFLREIDKNYVK